jgi:hypothetical protein
VKSLELWRWRYFDPATQHYSTTTYCMTQADAELHFPHGVKKVEGTHEVRMEADEDSQFGLALSGFIGLSPQLE